MMGDEQVSIEVPWLATFGDGRLHLNDEAGYRTWLPTRFGDGQRAMVIVVPLAEDTFHAAAYRYYRGCVLELIAEHMGEANPERVHAMLAGMFLPAVLSKTRRGVVKFTRRSTSMLSLPCDRFCAFLDRVTAWAEHPDELNLLIPMADPDWKWHAYQQQLKKEKAA
jgi:hypothetical protein